MDYKLSIPKSGSDSSGNILKSKETIIFSKRPLHLWLIKSPLSYSERITQAYGHSPQTDNLLERKVETEFCSTGISLSLKVDMAFKVFACTSEYEKGEK